MEKDLELIERQEQEEKEIRISELQINKAEKMMNHQEEIAGRPKRTWFQTHQERMHEKGRIHKSMHGSHSSLFVFVWPTW